MRQWLAFLFLGLLAWGSSFLWIKLSLRELGPMTMVGYRLLFGLATIYAVTTRMKFKVRYSGIEFWLPFLLGITSVAIPISLIGFAETRIDSGLAGVLNATMPLWTMIIAHFALHDDRLTTAKILGLISGIAGIVILLDPDLGATGDVVGQIAMIAATLFYALSAVSMRKWLRGVHPFQTSGPLMIGGAVFIWIAAAIFESPLVVPREPITWIAVAWMGILGMGFSTLAWFYLINHWGASRTSMVTFLFPPAAVALGILFLDEAFQWKIVWGALLIVMGIALVNQQQNKQPETRMK
ncbi:DMT family transporter [bacterium]|nr:DMT family transporter [bacterium]